MDPRERRHGLKPGESRQQLRMLGPEPRASTRRLQTHDDTVEGCIPAQRVDAILARHVIHAGAGMLSRHCETDSVTVVAPAMRQADDPGHHGGADLDWHRDNAGTGRQAGLA